MGSSEQVIEAAAGAIQNSVWKNRVIYSWAVTAALVFGLLAVCFVTKDQHTISTLAWLIFSNNILMLVAPTAEQIVKMMAQVAAIRAGAKVQANG